jgi:dTDP-4-dehydrorhamnose 3,5-epimerase
VREFEEQGIHFLSVQANMQFSPRKGTVRGLHLQIAPALEAKLVRCTYAHPNGSVAMESGRRCGPAPEWQGDMISFMESVG